MYDGAKNGGYLLKESLRQLLVDATLCMQKQHVNLPQLEEWLAVSLCCNVECSITQDMHFIPVVHIHICPHGKAPHHTIFILSPPSNLPIIPLV
ncbi:hypothetical protein EON63_16800 [archaeon]|nr:MAG: hypothetical protein EON63_16800 [archaeon]